MNCPFCSKEMRKGEVRSVGGRMIYWQPIRDDIIKMRFSTKSIEKHDGIVLCKNQNNMTSPEEAYICDECKKLIMSF